MCSKCRYVLDQQARVSARAPRTSEPSRTAQTREPPALVTATATAAIVAIAAHLPSIKRSNLWRLGAISSVTIDITRLRKRGKAQKKQTNKPANRC